MKKLILLVFGVALIGLGTVSAAAQDFKMTTRTAVAGRSFDSTTMVRGARQRTEANGRVTIIQCDLKRTIQINDAKKKYFIEPLETGDAATPSTPTAPPSRGKARKGGIVTMYIEMTDTGERKDFFGLTARHIIMKQRIEPGPGACQEEKTEFTTDGWYVDLNTQFNCETGGASSPMAAMMGDEGCRDEFKIVRKGTGRLGFPVLTTMKFGGGGGDADESAPMAAMMSFKTEVVELSRSPLADALFDIPAGYTLVKSPDELR